MQIEAAAAVASALHRFSPLGDRATAYNPLLQQQLVSRSRREQSQRISSAVAEIVFGRLLVTLVFRPKSSLSVW